MLHKSLAVLLVSGVCLAFAGPSEITIQKRQKKVARGYSKLKQKSIDRGAIRVIAKLKKKGTSTSKIGTLTNTISSLHSKGLKEKRVFKRFDASLYNLTPTQLDKLLDDPNVEFIQEDIEVQPTLTRSVPYIGASTAHAEGREGNGQIVAIFDTGVETDHPFLGGRVVDEACFSSEINSTTPGNVYKEFPTCSNGETRQYGSGAGVPCTDLDGGDGCKHGTHVAGIASGGSTSMDGVAPASDIIAVQVFTNIQVTSGDRCDGATSCMTAYTSDLIGGMEWLLDHDDLDKIASVNMSLGGGGYTSHCDGGIIKIAIDELKSHGVSTVIASGNNGYGNAVSYPGCVSSAITVGSVDNETTNISYFSNRATMVDVVAPGRYINSSVPGHGYESLNGTSMAAPHVAGAVALLKAQDPTLTVDEITNTLKETGLPSYDPYTTFGTPMIHVGIASEYVEDNKPTLATPAMTASSSPMYNRVTTNSNYSSSYPGWKMFDQSPTWSHWVSGRFKNDYARTANVMYASRGSKKIVSYELVGRPDHLQNRLPKNWKLQGSNSPYVKVDDSIYSSSWKTIDTRTNITTGDEWQITNNRNRVTFAVQSPASYTSYRICITEVNGSDVVDIIEMHLNK